MAHARDGARRRGGAERVARVVVLAAAALGWLPGITLAGIGVGPERLDPLTQLEQAKPGTVYLSTSKVKGGLAEQGVSDRLRYTWALPPGFETKKPRDLVTLIHNDQQDALWGHESYPPGSLGDDLISVAIDGTTDREDGTRVFAPRPQDAVQFRDFILEMTRTIPCRRIIHYGLGEGGLFATTFAGRFPALCSGVIAHNGGAAEIAATKGGVLAVPIVLLHGTDDEELLIGRSLAARESYAFDGHTMVFVHVLPKWQDQPCPAAVKQGVDLCVGLTTDDPAEAQQRAERLCVPGPVVNGKPVLAALHMARAVLRRVDLQPLPEPKRDPNIPGGGMRGNQKFPKPFKSVPTPVRERAVALASEIEGFTQTLIAPYRAKYPNERALRDAVTVNAGAPVSEQAKRIKASATEVATLWLLREELRGVDSMEAFAQLVKLDDLLTERADVGDELLRTLKDDPPVGVSVSAVIDAMPKLAGFHSLPVDLKQQMVRWCKSAGAPAGAAEKIVLVEAAAEGYRAGVAAFGDEMTRWSK